MEALWLVAEADELKEASPCYSEVCKSDNFIYEDESFRVIELVIIDEEVFILDILRRVLGLVDQQYDMHHQPKRKYQGKV